ncbi:hypothetical protein PSTG_18778, partial [Puccinia striiformis f. sp. tritici PST-78]
VAEFDTWFEDETIDLEDVEHWFHVDVLGAEEYEEVSDGVEEAVEQEGELRPKVSSPLVRTSGQTATSNHKTLPSATYVSETPNHILYRDPDHATTTGPTDLEIMEAIRNATRTDDRLRKIMNSKLDQRFSI